MNGALGFAAFLFFSVLLYLLVKNKESIKRVGLKNRLIVVITFICLLFFATLTIYYAGNWLAGFIDNESLKFAFRIIWILIMAALITRIWDSVLGKVKRESGIV